MSNAPLLQGSIVALVTPMNNHGEVDFENLKQLVEYHVQAGTDAIVSVGTTGESATLSIEENVKVILKTVEFAAGRIPVIAGTGANATSEAVTMTKLLNNSGIVGCLSVVPYYNKPTQEGLYRHYKAIASSVEIPVLLYNVPGRVGVDIQPCTVFRLFKECENVYGVKEATGSIERCVDLLAHEPDLSVISGEDAINYPILSNGGKGVISVTANLLPDEISNLTHFALKGEFARAKAINDDLYAVNKIMFCESNPIPVKAAMYIAGLISSLEYRLPLCEPSAENLKKIEQTIKQYNIKGF